MNLIYDVEKLSDDIFVCVSNNHRFGTDAFLLANFSSPRKKDIVCDLGTGCGIIPLILNRDFSPKKVYGVDIQQEAISLFNVGIEKSKLNQTVGICGDLKEIPSLLEKGAFDVVTCNPPYKASNAGILSELSAEKIARHEVLCNIYDVCKSASELLKFGGKLCLCQRPERLADVISAMKQYNIEPKLLRFVAKDKNSDPWLFLIEGKKGGKSFMKVKNTLYIKGDNGFSDELLKIYGNGKVEN